MTEQIVLIVYAKIFFITTDDRIFAANSTVVLLWTP